MHAIARLSVVLLIAAIIGEWLMIGVGCMLLLVFLRRTVPGPESSTARFWRHMGMSVDVNKGFSRTTNPK